MSSCNSSAGRWGQNVILAVKRCDAARSFSGTPTCAANSNCSMWIRSENSFVSLGMTEMKNRCDVDEGKVGLRRTVLILFRRERGNDFVKARVATQRIPNRMKTQLAVAQIARKLPCFI